MLRVSISKLADLAVCELKPYYNFVLRERPVFGEWVYAGSVQHALSAKIDKETKQYEKVNVEKMKELLFDEKSCVEIPSEKVRVEFSFGECVFSGRLDKFLKLGKSVRVIDEKFVSKASTSVHDRHHLQLGAYCHALKNGSTSYARGSKRVELGDLVFRDCDAYYKIIERNRESREVLFESEWQAFEEKKVVEGVKRFEKILGGDFDLGELKLGSNCDYCEFRLACKRNRMNGIV